MVQQQLQGFTATTPHLAKRAAVAQQIVALMVR
jgi:hypothetical protein